MAGVAWTAGWQHDHVVVVRPIDPMPDSNPLQDRNKHFVTTKAYEGAPIYPRREVCVITCLDPCTDPANSLELEAGDAVVMRNAGGVGPSPSQKQRSDVAFCLASCRNSSARLALPIPSATVLSRDRCRLRRTSRIPAAAGHCQHEPR